MTVDEYIAQLNSPMKEIVRELRAIVKNSSTDISEDIKWNSPTYSVNKNFCSIMAHRHYVNLQIFKGAHIKDVALLEGTGKDMRHIKISSLEEIDPRLITRILRQAIKLDA